MTPKYDGNIGGNGLHSSEEVAWAADPEPEGVRELSAASQAAGGDPACGTDGSHGLAAATSERPGASSPAAGSSPSSSAAGSIRPQQLAAAHESIRPISPNRFEGLLAFASARLQLPNFLGSSKNRRS